MRRPPKLVEYRIVDTSTVKGLEEAERLVASGWKVARTGLFLVYLYRRLKAP